jgi:hypothetical protein
LTLSLVAVRKDRALPWVNRPKFVQALKGRHKTPRRRRLRLDAP